MGKLLSIGVFFVSFLGSIQAWSQEASNPSSTPKKTEKSTFANQVLHISVRSDDFKDARRIRDWQAFMKALEKDQPQAVIFDINIKTSLSRDAQERILDSLSNLTFPTFAFVNPSATGTGALVAIGCDTIYMNESGIIGGGGVELLDTKNTEIQKRQLAQDLSLLKARVRGTAKAKGHRVDVVEAFIDSEAELTNGDAVISKKGEILTLTADEAVQPIDGKPLLAKAIAKSVKDIVDQEELDQEVTQSSLQKYTRQVQQDRLKVTSTPGTNTSSTEAGEQSEDDGLFARQMGKNYKGKIVRIEVGRSTLISKSRFEFMDRIVRKAQADGAEAVIFDLDTPGGLAWDTQELILKTLQDVTIPTYSFVNPQAQSAGAIVALGTDHIYMRPSSSIGSALVVTIGGDLPDDMSSKVTQAMVSVVRDTARSKGHNEDIAEAFVTRGKKVVINGNVIFDEGDEVLNLSASQATEIIDGQPVLAKGLAKSIDDIITQENLQGDLVDAESLGMESFAYWVQKYAILLIIIGIAGVYLEMQSPGFALPGAIGLLSFAIYFFGNNLAGNLAGYELVVVFVLGLVLIGIEIFLFPGTLVAGIIGGIMVLGSLGFAMVDKVDFESKMKGLPGAESWGELMGSGFLTLMFGSIGALALILAVIKFFPRTRMGGLLILDEAVAGGASIDGQSHIDPESGSDTGQSVSYLGWEGVAETDLRPAGKGRFKGKILDIISDGEYLNKDTQIIVSRHEGSRIVVKKMT